jgi:hypothetical protein
MEYGLKIAQQGENVQTASDNKLSFKSSILTMPIYLNSGVYVTSSPYTYTHNLGYVPKVWMFYFKETPPYYATRIPFEKTSGLSIVSIDYEIDETTIIIRSSISLMPFNGHFIIFTRRIDQ